MVKTRAIVEVKFSENKFIKFKLFNTPVAVPWITALGKWKHHNTSMITCINDKVPYSLNRDQSQAEAIVKEINLAINDLNSLSNGEKITDRAYIGMPWQQTNRLHRIFTTAYATIIPTTFGSAVANGTWKHNLPLSTMVKVKQASYAAGNNVVLPPEVTNTFIVDTKQLNNFIAALERLNGWVHDYEDLHESKRAYNLNSKLHKSEFSYLELLWDNYNENKGTTLHGNERIPYSELHRTFKTLKQEPADVFVAKAIQGKDYLTSYLQYDDLTEVDTTNLDCITGGLRIYSSNFYKTIYGKNSDLLKQTREQGIEDHFVTPVPIGKIIESNVDINNIDKTSTEVYSTGYTKPEKTYSSPVIELLLSNIKNII